MRRFRLNAAIVCRRGVSILLCVLACLVLACGASAKATFGVADTHPVGMPDDGAKFFDLMNDVGLQLDRITVRWDPTHPARIERRAELQRMLEQATDHEIDIVFSVYPTRAGALSSSRAKTRFVTFLKVLATAFPSVRTYVVGNEFNQPKFFQPQFAKNCKSVSGGNYLRLLARGYDALKSVDPDITVISSVSPRGNDDCKARSNISISPVRFIRDMGRAFTALHRDRPAFDEFGVHLYPNQPTDSAEKGYQWPKIGISNLDRLKQALWDAFHRTAQPAPDWQPAALAFGTSADALRPAQIWEGEVGWQVGVKKGNGSPYYGRENVKVTTEARQADIYAQVVRMTNCDLLVDAMNIFGFVDEPDLDRFQAGLLRADWTKRPSYKRVKSAVAAAEDGCQGVPVQWRHTQSVVGVGVDFGKLRPQSLKQTWWGFTATAKEDATYTAGVFPIQSRTLSSTTRAAILRGLGGRGGAKAALRRRSTIAAYWSPIVRFPARTLARGNYVFAIRINATMNPGRSRVFVSRPFQVGKPRS